MNEKHPGLLAIQYGEDFNNKYYKSGFLYKLSGVRNSQLEVFRFRADLGTFLEDSGFDFLCFEPIGQNMPAQVLGTKDDFGYKLGFGQELKIYRQPGTVKEERHDVHVTVSMPPDSQIPSFLQQLRDYLLAQLHFVAEKKGVRPAGFM